MRTKKGRGRHGKGGKGIPAAQHSVRIDPYVSNAAKALVAKSGEKITDVIERGMLREVTDYFDLPELTHQYRFILGQANVEQQRQLVKHFRLMQLGDDSSKFSASIIAQILDHNVATNPFYADLVRESYPFQPPMDLPPEEKK